MRSTLLRLSLLATILVGLAGPTACSYRNEDLNRIVDPYWSKEYFAPDHEWYFRSTVVDAPPNHGWISVADGDWLMLEKIRWEVTEDALIGWRSYAEVPGSESEDLPGADDIYKGQAVAIFAITDHFDIRRDFDPTSGEESNVITENRDRLWFDRAFMRVDWSHNLVGTYKYHINLNEPYGIGLGGSNPTHTYGSDQPGNPKRWRFEPEYFEVTTRTQVVPDLASYYAYYGVPYTGDSSGALIDVRHSFQRVDETSDYEALPMPPSVALEDENGNEVRDARGFVVRVPINDRFGYFGSLGRNTFDQNRGMITSGQIHNAARFNIWEQSKDANGNSIPLHDRTPKAIVYYTNVEHPEQLMAASQRVAAGWNKAFRETVYELQKDRYTAADGDGDGLPDDVPTMFELRRNDCNVANVESVLAGLSAEHSDLVAQVKADAARTTVNDLVTPFDGSIEDVRRRFDDAQAGIENLGGTDIKSFTALQDEETQALNDLERICSALEYRTAADATLGIPAPAGVIPFKYQRLGDNRYSMLDLLVGDFQSGWLGLGPPYADPNTGETISATANIAVSGLDTYAARAAQFVSALNGEIDPTDLTYGFDIEKYMQKKLLENAQLLSKKPSEQARERMDERFEARAGQRELLREIPPGRAAEKMSRLVGTEIEQKLISKDDVIAFGHVDPTAAASMGLDDALLDAASPLRGANMFDRYQRRQQQIIRMGMRAADPPEMIDNMLIGQALAYRDMSYFERFKKLRQDILVAVALHEVGHNTGLFHNFAGSTDALNYGPFFWETENLPRDLDAARAELGSSSNPRAASRIAEIDACKAAIGENTLDPDTSVSTQDCLRQSEGMYSSIMDYHANWNSDFNGLGPYDHAATKFAYGQLVEVFPTENLDASIASAAPGKMKENLLYNDWRNIPDMFAGASRDEKIQKMHARSYTHMDWNTSSTRQGPLVNEVPYRFGYGAYPEPLVKVFDFGPDTRSNAAFQLTRYYQHYFFTHFARNRLWDFDIGGPVNVDLGVLDDFTEKMQWYFFQRATDPKFKGSYAEEDYLQTTLTGLNLFSHILGEPGSGQYFSRPKFALFGLGNEGVEERNTDPSDVLVPWSSVPFCEARITGTIAEDADGGEIGPGTPDPGYTKTVVPLGEGRPFFVGLTDDYEDWYIRYVGNYWTKLYAIQWLGYNYAYFPRVDADSDWRTFDVSWYRLFPKEVSKMYYNLIAQNDVDLGGFVDANGNFVARDAIDPTTLEEPDYTGLKKVLPTVAFNHQYYALLFANAFMDSPFDDTVDMSKSLRVGLQGGDDDMGAFDAAAAADAVNCAGLSDDELLACQTTISFTHPITGQTLRALKNGLYPAAFDLLKRANVLRDRFERLDACVNDLASTGTTNDAYCDCIEDNNGRSCAVDDFVVIPPGTEVTRGTGAQRAVFNCSAFELQNRRDSAREAMDDIVDYTSDLRTINKYLSGY